jgi:EAL domain-containing protein (putative c-di-GMP-specific phosphodiesterase class I)
MRADSSNTEPAAGSPPLGVPYIERYPEVGGPPERVHIGDEPVVIGRAETADFTIYSGSVSKNHAALLKDGDRYVIRDLNSTNGTFVNGQRVDEQVLTDGDIIHIAHIEFCFRATVADAPADAVDLGTHGTQPMRVEPSSLIRGTELLRELIDHEAVDIVFQPIVDLHTSEVIGLEALGRGTHPGLSERPAVLLEMAEQCGMAIPLSQLFRRMAVQARHRLPGNAKLFLNVHPRELGDLALLDAIAGLGLVAKTHPIVMEIPESAVTDAGVMARLQEAFREFNLEFAYDDFGAGQARLLEMADQPPHYLKFDRTMIDGVESASSRRAVVGALIGVAERLGIQVIAEGIETAETAAACRELGFRLGQGFLLSVPARL